MEKVSTVVVGVVLALAVVLTALQYVGLAPGVSGAGTELVSVHVPEGVPATDPESALWDRTLPLSVPLSGQLVVLPNRPTPSVAALEVRSLNDGTRIAFRVSWSDPTKDNRTTRLQEFRDAVAIQVARRDGTPPLCMGSADARLHIMQWKADWQADIEEGFRDLQHAFPNFWVDYYPFAVGEPPYAVPDAFPDEARTYLVGYEVGNPFSDPLKVTPVEDAVAEGFSTITTQENQSALGRGVWKDGWWSVVISRRLDTGDPQDTRIEAENVLAFAVWDGASGDVGARKSVSTWVVLRVESGAPADLVVRLVAVAVVVTVAFVLLVWYARRRRRRPEEAREEPEEAEPG